MKISNYKEINKGALKASFTVELPSGLEIRKLKVVDAGKGPFIGFPSERYESGGETRYINLVTIPDRDRRDAFTQAILSALKPYMDQAAEDDSDDGEDGDLF